MKVRSVRIESFRSIVDQTLVFTSNCIGLVGLNESGKSNILCAVRTLDKDYRLKKSDISKISEKLPSITFDLEIEETDLDTFKRYISSWLTDNAKVSIDDIFTRPVSLISNIKRTITMNDKFEIISSDEFEFSTYINQNVLIATKYKGNEALPFEYNGETATVSNSRFILSSNATGMPDGVYSKASSIWLKAYLKPTITKAITSCSPNVTYWEYDTKHLIPSEISYDELIKSDDIREFSVPLYNIFYICKEFNIEEEKDIQNQITLWKQDSGKRRRDSDIINSKVNSYIKKIWPDYSQEISINLEETKITVHVKDPLSPNKNYYEMIERSQGFKTFISFILTMAIDAENYPAYIMILDEPETHLHPSGVRFMREELYKLSDKGNQILFATHSIFMINRKELDKHIIVTKEYEKTTLKPVTRNNKLQESVIYEALGTTVDEFSISAFNIIFEGGLDRYLFDYFCSKCLPTNKNKTKRYDLQDGGGTNSISRFFHDKCLPKDSTWVFVLDRDKAADNLVESLKTSFGDNYSKQCTIFSYGKNADDELEDILPLTIVVTAFRNAVVECGFDSVINTDLNKSKTISSQIKERYSRANMNKTDIVAVEALFKDMLLVETKQVLDSQISSHTKIADRHIAFKDAFTEYHDFIVNMLQALP